MAGLSVDLAEALRAMRALLAEHVIPFWLTRSVDGVFGGYLTCFDGDGNYQGPDEKYIVTQCRMIWGFSHLLPYAREKDRPAMERAAQQGARFLIDKFWDRTYGGFAWRVARNGAVLDNAKLMYGESFALYALSEFGRAFGDAEAMSYAERTFELMQLYAADTRHGGYYENLGADWAVEPDGVQAGDRKSLDIHMHLMEAFTTLYQATGREIHGRKLREVLDLIVDRMVNREGGYGYNQFGPDFVRRPAIAIPRTWNAERKANEAVAEPTDTTSYGHNVELSWLADQAIRALSIDRVLYDEVLRGLLDHAVRHGYDERFGGVYRDGLGEGEALVTDKEWWQNFESMVGFLNGYDLYGDERFLKAFGGTWAFIQANFLHPTLGESRQLLSRSGEVLVGDIGNPWKGIYHTGRALAECVDRLVRQEGMAV